MLRQGPIPYPVHGLIEYLAGAILIAAPTFLLDFDSGTATGLSVALGVLVLAVAASTEGPTGLIDQIPRSAHAALDYVLAVALIAMPFIAGFSGEGTPTAFFIVLGVLHLLVSIGTAFRPE